MRKTFCFWIGNEQHPGLREFATSVCALQPQVLSEAIPAIVALLGLGEDIGWFSAITGGAYNDDTTQFMAKFDGHYEAAGRYCIK